MDISFLPVVNAGFPSPAEPFIERRINTQDLLGIQEILTVPEIWSAVRNVHEPFF